MGKQVGDIIELNCDCKITHSNGIICEFKRAERYKVIQRLENKTPVLLGVVPENTPTIGYLNHIKCMSNSPCGYCFWIEEDSVIAV